MTGSTLRTYLDPIFAQACAGATHLAVAVSGGADSMALALLAKPWCDAHNVALSALTVDHGLRAGSAEEALQVQHWMGTLGIAHRILTPQADAAIRNTQTRAREMRYRAMADDCHAHGVRHLLLAHHADDQAETVLLQQHRGDTPPSRSGMALVREEHGLLLVRPLLGVRKRTLMDYLNLQQQPWVEDPTNASDAYARNRLRQQLSEPDVLAAWQQAQTAGAQRHRDEQARNAWLAEYASTHDDEARLDYAAWCALPNVTRTDVLSHVIQRVGGKAFRPRLHETQRLDAQLRQQPHGSATLGHCLIRWQEHGMLCIRPEMRAEQSLDFGENDSHITGCNPPIALGNMPFWWFNHRLF